MHFTWNDRTTGAVEADLIIFPEEAVMKKLKQVPRVLLLEFKSSSRKLFFWLQESKGDKDDEFVSKVNEYINNPPNPEGGEATGLPPGVDQAQMMQMLQQAGLAPPRPPSSSSSQSAAATPGAASSANISDLQSILAGMGMPASAVSSMLGQAAAPARAAAPSSQPSSQPSQQATHATPTLQQIINADAITPLLMSPQVQADLLPFLPEGRRTPEELGQILRSPQFQQSLESFSSALQSGQLGELLRQFGLDVSGVEGFLRALQRHVERQQQQQRQ